MTEHSFEDFLRTALATAVEGAAPPPLAARARRRVRMRQAALLGAAGVVVLAGSFGAVRAGAAVFAGDDLPPAGPSGELMDERGSGGSYPCSFEGASSGAGSGCVAEGERDGLRWRLGAALDPKQGLCLILETVGGATGGAAGSSCDEYEPGTIGLGQTGMGGLPMLAYGHVPAATERLVLEHGADDSFELEVYPAPAGFPLDVRFYLVWLPDDAVQLVAYDSSGEIVTTRPFDGPSEAPPADPERVDVAEVVHEGSAWKVQAYGVEEDGREIACVRMQLRTDPTAALGPCDPSFGRGSAVGLSPFASPELPGVIAFGGVTSSKTASVTFVTAAGREVEAIMLEAPATIERSLGFFAAFVPAAEGEASGTVVVRDRKGDVIEERDYCVPGGDGLSC